jgi:hypothetical protein
MLRLCRTGRETCAAALDEKRQPATTPRRRAAMWFVTTPTLDAMADVLAPTALGEAALHEVPVLEDEGLAHVVDLPGGLR